MSTVIGRSSAAMAFAAMFLATACSAQPEPPAIVIDYHAALVPESYSNGFPGGRWDSDDCVEGRETREVVWRDPRVPRTDTVLVAKQADFSVRRGKGQVEFRQWPKQPGAHPWIEARVILSESEEAHARKFAEEHRHCFFVASINGRPVSYFFLRSEADWTGSVPGGVFADSAQARLTYAGADLTLVERAAPEAEVRAATLRANQQLRGAAWSIECDEEAREIIRGRVAPEVWENFLAQRQWFEDIDCSVQPPPAASPADE